MCVCVVQKQDKVWQRAVMMVTKDEQTFQITSFFANSTLKRVKHTVHAFPPPSLFSLVLFSPLLFFFFSFEKNNPFLLYFYIRVSTLFRAIFLFTLYKICQKKHDGWVIYRKQRNTSIKLARKT